MDGAVIRCRLDLMLRLVDTSTGAVVTEGDVRFIWNNKPIRSTPKEDGVHIFLNHGRDNGPMQILAKGYDPVTLELDYEKLDEMLPGLDVFLIPSEDTYRGGRMLTFSGRLSKLETIDAVNIGKPLCNISEFDAKKNIMALFLPGRRISMDDVHYGLADKDGTTYEPIVVTETISNVTVRLKEPLKLPFTVNAPIYRIIFGSVDAKGNFVLRVRDNGGDQRHLIRIVVDGEERFMTVDFEHLSGVKLTAAKPRPEEPKESDDQGEDKSKTPVAQSS